VSVVVWIAVPVVDRRIPTTIVTDGPVDVTTGRRIRWRCQRIAD
jgi:hypothetical protein